MASSGSGWYQNTWSQGSGRDQRRSYSSNEESDYRRGHNTHPSGERYENWDHDLFPFQYSSMESSGRTAHQKVNFMDARQNLMEECTHYREVSKWFTDAKALQKKRVRSVYKVYHEKMNTVDIENKLKDVVCWILRHGRDQFDGFTQWQAEFIRFMMGFVSQGEEDWFDKKADTYAADMRHGSQLKNFSKNFTSILRLKQGSQWMFDARGTVELATLFDRLRQRPMSDQEMTGAKFAAFLHANEKSRFMIDIYLKDLWIPDAVPPETPFEIRMGCVQGHTSLQQDPRLTHHALTKVEAGCLGWIFHVTDLKFANSIDRNGLYKTRDAVHFMYHNDNGAGYIAMSSGTKAPREYKNPVYFVLNPEFLEEGDLFLTRNGVVLTYQQVPAKYLIRREQLPTIASNVLHNGRGHHLSPEVTGGLSTSQMSYEDLRREKGDSYEPGGPVPAYSRETAWQYMNQSTPKNYANLFFRHSLPTKEAWQRLWEMSHRGKEQAKEKESKRESSTKVEESKEASGSSTNVEVPKSTPAEEKKCSSTEEAPEHMQVDEEDTEASSVEEVEVESEFITRAKSSRGADNPWMLYDAGVIVARKKARSNDGGVPGLELNDFDEKIIHLIDYEKLFANQQLALFRQGIQEQEWMTLPWTGYLCYFFTFAWDTGRKMYLMKRQGDLYGGQKMMTWLSEQGHDFMKGLKMPDGFEGRFDQEKKFWPEVYHDYERRTYIQKDFEYMVDVVTSFFEHGLEKFIRRNPCLWGDMCKRTANGLLDLDAGDIEEGSGQTVEASSKTVKPQPEFHFRFSTRLMEKAYEIYQNIVPYTLQSPFGTLALKRLKSYVRQKETTNQASLELLIEKHYTSYMYHEALLSTARSRTKVRCYDGQTNMCLKR